MILHDTQWYSMILHDTPWSSMNTPWYNSMTLQWMMTFADGCRILQSKKWKLRDKCVDCKVKVLILNCAIRFFTIDILWVFIGLENLKLQSYCFAIWHNAYASLFSLHLGHSIFQKCESSHFFFISNETFPNPTS